MFNIGFSELVVLSIIALIVIGPKQLPQIAKTVARALNEIKRATEEITGDFMKSARESNDEIKKTTTKFLDTVNSSFDESEYQKKINEPNLPEGHTPLEGKHDESGDSGEGKA